MFKKSESEKINNLRLEYDQQQVKKLSLEKDNYRPSKDVFVSLRNIQKIYPNGVHSVIDFNLEIKKGEFIVFVGSSGCGKTTTLRMVCGLEDITAGSLYIDGVLSNDLPPSERGVSIVFQNYALFPHLTVYENIAYGLKTKKVLAPKLDKEGKQIVDIDYRAIKKLEKEKNWIQKNDPNNLEDLENIDHDIEQYKNNKIPLMVKRKLNKKEIDEKVLKAAKILNLTDLLYRKPGQLSGGQCQRVALGRVIVSDAKLLLMDEPLSNLDAKLRVTMRSEILKLHKSLSATTIYVTHDQIEAMTMSDRLVVMNKGRIMQIGTPKEVYNHPNNLFVATFIGSPSMNILEAKIINDDLYVDNYLIQKNGNFKIKDFYEERLKEEENYLLSLKDKMTGLLLEDETKIVNQRIENVKSMLNENIYNVKLGIRPEDIVINHGELICKIDTYELINEEYQIYATFNENKIMFKSSKQVNEEVNFEFKKDKIHLFDNIYERAF